MRWFEPYHHQERVVKYFLIVPRTICRETRWLETVYIQQWYSKWKQDWFDIDYVTEEEYIKYKEKGLNESNQCQSK